MYPCCKYLVHQLRSREKYVVANNEAKSHPIALQHRALALRAVPSIYIRDKLNCNTSRVRPPYVRCIIITQRKVHQRVLRMSCDQPKPNVELTECYNYTVMPDQRQLHSESGKPLCTGDLIGMPWRGA